MFVELGGYSDNPIRLFIAAVLLLLLLIFVAGPLFVFIIVEIVEWVFSFELGLSYWKLFALAVAVELFFSGCRGACLWRRR